MKKIIVFVISIVCVFSLVGGDCYMKNMDL